MSTVLNEAQVRELIQRVRRSWGARENNLAAVEALTTIETGLLDCRLRVGGREVTAAEVVLRVSS